MPFPAAARYMQIVAGEAEAPMQQQQQQQPQSHPSPGAARIASGKVRALVCGIESLSSSSSSSASSVQGPRPRPTSGGPLAEHDSGLCLLLEEALERTQSELVVARDEAAALRAVCCALARLNAESNEALARTVQDMSAAQIKFIESVADDRAKPTKKKLEGALRAVDDNARPESVVRKRVAFIDSRLE